MMKRLYILLLLWPLAAGAEVYRWTDDQGRVHFGDGPPTASRSEKLATPAAAPAPTDAGAAARARTEQLKHFSEVYEQEQAEKKAARDKAREEAATRKANCEKAKRLHAGRTQAGRIQYEDAAGNRRDLSNAERAAAESEARLAVEQWCK